MQLHTLNRSRLVDKLTPLLNGQRALVVLDGSKSQCRDSSDHEPLFRQESYFHWAFGVQEPDFSGLISVPDGSAVLFAPKLPEDYAVWMGKLLTQEEIKDRYGVDEVVWSEDMSHKVVSLDPQVILTLKGINSDSGIETVEATFNGIESFKVDNQLLFPMISDLRVFKTPLEMQVIRYSCKLSSDAHIQVMKSVRPGMKEYQLESIFRHYCYYEGGARFMSYTCICASGNNGATLHYGHAGAPNDKTIEDGDMCLFDMGCEYYCYASDITCSFPVSGKFTSHQKVIYNAVLKANRAVFNAVKPGVSWTIMHLLAERTQLEELKAAGLLQGSVDEMMFKRLGAVFMPHGLGHFLGIDTHDVGGYLSGAPSRSTEAGLKSLRTARILEEGMVLTIEPGIYFIDTLLDKALSDPETKDFFVPEAIETFRGFGGVRIEDNILVTYDGAELLSPVPRTVEEIEAVIEEGRKTIQIVLPQDKVKEHVVNGGTKS